MEDKEITDLFQQTERKFEEEDFFYIEPIKKNNSFTMKRIVGIAASIALAIVTWSSVPFTESMYDASSIIIEAVDRTTTYWYAQISKF